MKKRTLILRIVGGLVVLLLAVVISAWVMIDRIAKSAVESGGHYALGVPTTVDTLSLSLLGGTLQMDTLNISNPAGYNSAHLMRSGKFHVAVSPASLLGDVVVVPTFELDGLDVNIESKSITNNISVVLDHVKQLGGDSAAPKVRPSESQQPSSSKKVRVDKIVIRNVVAHVLLPLPGSKPLLVTVPTIELNNVSSDQGITVAQLIGRIMPAIVAAILESGKGIIPGDLLATLNSDVAGAVNALGGKAAELVQQGVTQASAQVQQALTQAIPGASSQITRRAQGALDQVQKEATGQIENIMGGTEAKPAESTEKKDGVGKAMEGLFKKK